MILNDLETLIVLLRLAGSDPTVVAILEGVRVMIHQGGNGVCSFRDKLKILSEIWEKASKDLQTATDDFQVACQSIITPKGDGDVVMEDGDF